MSWPGWAIIGVIVLIALICVVWSRTRSETAPSYGRLEHTAPTTSDVKPQVRELSEPDMARLNQQRAVVLQAAKTRYGTLELHADQRDLLVLQKLIDDKVFAVTQTYELQSLGVVFGDALAKAVDGRWVMISDEYGTDPTVEINNTSFHLNALTMISKRIEHGEVVNVKALYDVVVADTPRLRSEHSHKE